MMNIILPKSFHYSGNELRDFAFVRERELKLIGPVNYEKIMYALTYAEKGEERCYYCGKKMTPKTRTLDHMYPRAFGGISIPNNLVPACSKCNEEKKDMTFEQYMQWQEISGKKDRKDFYMRCHKENLQKFENGELLLPENWLDSYYVSKIAESFLTEFGFELDESLDGMPKHFLKMQKPLVVTANGYILKGLKTAFWGIKCGKSSVPAIILENVVKLDFW